MAWGVVHTQVFKEQVAAEQLRRQGFIVYLPCIKKLRRHARTVREVLVPLFPRYLFVHLEIDAVPWHRIHSTRGVSYLLMANNTHPALLSCAVIEQLKSREISEGVVSVESLMFFKKGDVLRVLEGPFKDHLAYLESMDDQGRVHLLLDFLGQPVSMVMPFYAVEAS